ncbi:hypothetical protein [Paenibacillus sp. QZ-Y1]|uniref:hypothetical protein n=1 Tax=Paenibacillus sp. QZ-Y1 TaxID=3414511 RepID=UPI003F7959FA
MKKAFLLHPYENVNGNLRWSSKNQFDQAEVISSLEELRKLGYWASAFPEGDGITFSKDEYSSEQSLEDFVKTFSWLEIEQCDLSELNNRMRDVLIDQKSVCNILVPIRSLQIEDSFQIGDYKFWSPNDLKSPWIDYFGGYHLHSEEYVEEWNEELKTEMDLLRFPLIELTIEVNEADLIGLNNSIESEVRLIRIASEQADRGLDLLRITHCNYNRIEYLPDRAGQLADGFTAAYIIPEQREYKEKLLVHIVYSMRTTNNWLGLEAEYISDPFVEWLARLLKGEVNNEIEQSVRSAVISISQAFYTIYDEARFLSLVFSLDGLCSPKRRWTGWKHRSYIAAITSAGNVNSYERELKKFEHLYTNIRNKLVHAGSSFIDIEGEDPMSVSQDIHSLIIRSIMTIYKKELTSIEQLHDFAITLLQKNEYQQVTDSVINDYDLIRGRQTQQSDRPNW